MRKGKHIYFRIKVKSEEDLRSANEFARELRLSGIDIADWFFAQSEKWKKADPEALNRQYLTQTAVIELAYKQFGLVLTSQDLQYWRNKRKLPKLRPNFDYVREKGVCLYKRSKLNKFFKAVQEFRAQKEENRDRKRRFGEGQEWTADASHRPVEKKSVINVQRTVTALNPIIEE